ncbi:MAG: PASTA domain-containing protein [Candidatus Eremiobacteraeota bacterium]|nr:PASTA domain-containing protein [Candidatus Eremiobacteraeota bacterium]
MITGAEDGYRKPFVAMLREYVPRDWVFPIVLAVFVAIVVWFARSIHDFVIPTGTTLMVPSFVGQTLGDANKESYRYGLRTQVVARQISDRYPKDIVMGQEPASGTRVREGRQVSLVVSNGVQIYSMPDMRFQTMREAGLDLSHLRLALGKVTFVKNDEVPANHIVDQDPAPLTSVREGTAVNLTISKGGASQVRVPNFEHETIDEARGDADRAHVKLGQIVWMPLGPKGPPHGEVVHQTPAAGSKIDSFEPVSLEVSAGPHESGYILRQVHLIASVPADQMNNKPERVSLIVTDMTGKYKLYDAYALAGQKLDFIVPALGTSVVDFFVNNTLVAESRLGREPPAVYDEPRKPGQTPASPRP